MSLVFGGPMTASPSLLAVVPHYYVEHLLANLATSGRFGTSGRAVRWGLVLSDLKSALTACTAEDRIARLRPVRRGEENR
jgi:hypothetical protein